MAKHHVDATALLDNRGYYGPLIRGQNPASLIDTGVRDRIVESYYWKEQCFGLNEASLCDRAVELLFIGGTYGDIGKPTPFLCLLFKLLQLNPSRDIILEYLNWYELPRQSNSGRSSLKGRKQKSNVGRADHENGNAVGNSGISGSPVDGKGEFKYLRALAAFYVRLTWSPLEIYETLEPLLLDYRKLRRRTKTGEFILTHIDLFVEDLLTKDRVCAVSLWKLPPRYIMEDTGGLLPRISPLDEELFLQENPINEHVGNSGSAADSRSDTEDETVPSRGITGKYERQNQDREDIKKTGSRKLPTRNDREDNGHLSSTRDNEATKSARPVGPQKASLNVRMTNFIDYAPDVCKDYKQTGFCGFGDSCKFLHAREDFKQGWAIEKDWQIVENRRSRYTTQEGDKSASTCTDAQCNDINHCHNGDEPTGQAPTDDIPFACFICKKSYKNPIVTRCLHYFCENCALTRYRKTPTCAACKADTGGVFRTAKRLSKLQKSDTPTS